MSERPLGTSIPNEGVTLHGHLELRALLEEPMCIEYLSNFADSIQKRDILLFWFEVEECNSDPSDYSQLRACERIHRRFLAGDNSPLSKTSVNPADRSEMDIMLRSSSWKETIKTARETKRPERGTGSAVVAHRTLTMLTEFQRVCFEALYTDVFLAFKLTAEFRQMCLALEKQYKQISIADFDYFEKLGEGAFGVVVSCRKRSTGEVFAMKVQRKRELLEHHDLRPQSVTDERLAHSLLSHPFIVEVSYAFQTSSLVAMAMTLCPNGDMFTLLQTIPGKQLPHEHVLFYSAEILSALTYIHQQGLIYRDLKLENILLSQDGHVKMADFGAIAYVIPSVRKPDAKAVSGGTSSSDKIVHGVSPTDTTSSPMTYDVDTQGLASISRSCDYSSINTMSYNSPAMAKGASAETRCAPIFAPKCGFSSAEGAPVEDLTMHYTPCPAESTTSEKLQQNPALLPVADRPRTMSVTGTIEYMSPEMMYICQKPFKAAQGYTNAVDYWCLGTIMHLLYTGRFPFRAKGNADCPAPFPEESEGPVDEQLHFMNTYYGTLKLDRGVFSTQTRWGDATRSIISGLLTFDPSSRLGSGRGAGYEIMAHPYYASIDWRRLYNKEILPPSLHQSVKTSCKSLLTVTGVLTGRSTSHMDMSAGSPDSNSLSLSIGRRHVGSPGSPAIEEESQSEDSEVASSQVDAKHSLIDMLCGRKPGGDGKMNMDLSVSNSKSKSSTGNPRAKPGKPGAQGDKSSHTSLELVLQRSGVLRTWMHNGGVCSADDFKFFRQWNYVASRAITLEKDKKAIGSYEVTLA